MFKRRVVRFCFSTLTQYCEAKVRRQDMALNLLLSESTVRQKLQATSGSS